MSLTVNDWNICQPLLINRRAASLFTKKWRAGLTRQRVHVAGRNCLPEQSNMCAVLKS